MEQKAGDCGERGLNHSDGEAQRFYRELKQRGVGMRVGMEATGQFQVFRELLILVEATAVLRAKETCRPFHTCLVLPKILESLLARQAESACAARGLRNSHFELFGIAAFFSTRADRGGHIIVNFSLGHGSIRVG
jgi:hypothetical protein